MNILQILPELNVGGVETGTVDFAKYLVAKGHRSVVVSNGGELLPELQASGSMHYTLPVNRKSIFTMIYCLRKLEDIIRKEKIDIVHARSRVPAWIAFFACRKTKTAFVTTCHGYYTQHLFSHAMGWGKMVICISDVIGRHMVHDFKVPPENIRVIPRSVDLERFKVVRPPPKAKSMYTVTMIGRITPIKGHEFFLRAMARVIRSMPYVKVQIVGDAAPKRQSFKEGLVILARRLGIADHVEFMGNRRDIPEILAHSDLVVLATVTQEAFGRVILEAQAAGVPVVATKVGGVVEIVEHEKTGLLVLPKDPDSMAQAIMRILNDTPLAQQMVLEARRRIETKFTLQQMAEQTLRVYEDVLRSLNILVIKFSAMGDVVLITASLKALREKFPHARIQCLVGKESASVLHRCPYIDGVLDYDAQGRDKGWPGLMRLAAELRRVRFDKVIDFQNNRRSHLLAYLTLAPETFGYHNKKWGRLLTDKIRDPGRPMPPVEHQFQVLRMLGIEYPPDAALEIWPSPRDHEYVQNILDGEWMGHWQNMVGLNIAASPKWPTKNWPIEHMARLCDLLAQDNIRVIVTGQDKDKPLARQLLKLTKAKPVNFVGKTNLLQLAALIKKCRVYVSLDSAPLHVAAAMDVPVVALFGPTDPGRHMPPARQATVVQHKVECAPCYSGRCRVMTHVCMTMITPETVAAKVKELMGVKV